MEPQKRRRHQKKLTTDVTGEPQGMAQHQGAPVFSSVSSVVFMPAALNKKKPLLPLGHGKAGFAVEVVEHDGFGEVQAGFVHALHERDDL